MTRTLRRALGVVVAAATAATLLVGGAVPAHAVDGLSVGATSRYVLDPAADLVHATITVDLRNVTPDKQSGGGVYFYYFDSFTVPVPAGSESLRAESGGASLPVSLEGTADPGVSLARMSFPDLRYGETRRITLSFDIPGEPPRSKDPTRVGPGYATFVVYGPGDEGRNQVEVTAPSSMSFLSTTDDFQPSESGGTTTYVATRNTDGGGLWAAVSLRDPKQTAERTVDVDEDLAVVLEAFPDDRKWSAFVAEKVVKGIPALEELVGSSWPGGLQRIREDASPILRGYDGWFDPNDDEIVVGEQLDSDLIFHELSHAWFDDTRFDERWLTEGLAQVVAERTVKATGGTPMEHPAVSRTAPGAFALNTWEGDARDRSGEADAYAYPASYLVMSRLTRRLDDERFAAVVGAGIRGERAYDPPGTVAASAGRTTWSDWLDLVETRAGVANAPALFSQWVLTKEQRGQLKARSRARAAYAALDAADGSWLPPEGLRDAMTFWDFERAETVHTAVAPLGAPATAVQTAAEHSGLPVPVAVRESYEKADTEDDYRDLAASLPRAASAITAVGAAQREASAEHDPFTDLGQSLLQVDERAGQAVALLEDGDVDRASVLARDATGRAAWALPAGIGLPLLVVLLLVAGALLARGHVRRHGRHPEGMHPEGMHPEAAAPGAVPGASPAGAGTSVPAGTSGPPPPG